MPFVRPNGVMCSGYVYPDKKNTFEKLKDFLFNNNSGRKNSWETFVFNTNPGVGFIIFQ